MWRCAGIGLWNEVDEIKQSRGVCETSPRSWLRTPGDRIINGTAAAVFRHAVEERRVKVWSKRRLCVHRSP